MHSGYAQPMLRNGILFREGEADLQRLFTCAKKFSLQSNRIPNSFTDEMDLTDIPSIFKSISRSFIYIVLLDFPSSRRDEIIF